MAKPSHQPGHDTAPLDWIQQTTRLRPDLHVALEAHKARTGRSINMAINDAVEEYLIANTGVSKIARMRRRLLPRTSPAHAAVAYLLGYLGNASQARHWWPWSGRLVVKEGDTDLLVLAGALIAAEDDRRAGRWVTSVSPSASGP